MNSKLHLRPQNKIILRYQLTKNDKKASSGLIREFTIKKFELNLRVVFFRKRFLFLIVFQSL